MEKKEGRCMDQEKDVSQLTTSEWVKRLKGKELSQFTACEYGELLTRIRKHIDKTQPEMADLLNVGFTTYQKWEWGRRKPRAEYRRRIRKAFEEMLYVWGILKREDDPESQIPAGEREKQQPITDQKTTESPTLVVAVHRQSSPDSVDMTIIDSLETQAEVAKNEFASSSFSLAQENVVQSEYGVQLCATAFHWAPSQDIGPLDLPTM